jgi:hypothetical protein
VSWGGVFGGGDRIAFAMEAGRVFWGVGLDAFNARRFAAFAETFFGHDFSTSTQTHKESTSPTTQKEPFFPSR